VGPSTSVTTGISHQIGAVAPADRWLLVSFPRQWIGLLAGSRLAPVFLLIPDGPARLAPDGSMSWSELLMSARTNLR